MRVVCVQTKERKYRKALEKNRSRRPASKDFANRGSGFALKAGSCKKVNCG